jgi:hypothetical protein
MDWSPDFCLSCDRQLAEGGAYCSQACRLADLEKAGTTEPHTPSQLSSSASSASSANGFYLPPAVNFSAYKTPSPSRGFDASPSTPYYYYYPASNGSYFAPSTPTASRYQQQQQQPRSLTPSSSRSSLASNVSQSTPGISAHAASQLDSYVRSFDQVRQMKRRLT